MQDKRIFVSIAAYRDTETTPTLVDMYAKAKHPSRVFAGVFWQTDLEHDSDCMQVPDAIPHHQLRGLHAHPKDSLGACWARSRILTELRQDEEFVLQIDSHMRFVQDWDERMLQMLEACPSPKALLSTYPVAYEPPDKLNPPRITIMRPNKFNERGLLRPLAVNLPYEERPAKPFANPLISAGFLFGPAECFDQVPYDPSLYFFGEEISYAVRLWTHGWDVFTPNDVLIYHFYGRLDNRPKHWTDNPLWTGMNEVSQSRVRHLLGIEVSADSRVTRDLDRYGLGTQRTIAEYERFAGISFTRSEIHPSGWAARFPQHPSKDWLHQQRTFEDVFHHNTWKAWETRSGFASTLPATHELRQSLQTFFVQQGVRSLVDAGCGDVYWMERLTEGLELYLGIDVAPGVIEQNIRMFGHRTGHFFAASDITSVPIARADVVLCRNVLNVLSVEAAMRALGNLVASKAQHLMLTTTPGAKNEEGATGVHRALDLCAEPFCLPAPRQMMADYRGQMLGVWVGADLLDWQQHHATRLRSLQATASARDSDGPKPLPVMTRVISMRPEFWNRLRDRLHAMHVNPELWQATDGRDIDQEQWKQLGTMASAPAMQGRALTRGELGCYDSHRRVWQSVVDQSLAGVLVLEDDAKPDEGLRQWVDRAWEHREQWDVLFLGYTWAPRTTLISGVEGFVKPDMRGGWHVMHAYMLTATGAQKLLRSALPIELPVDVYVARRALEDLRVWQVQKSVVPTYEDTYSGTQAVR